MQIPNCLFHPSVNSEDDAVVDEEVMDPAMSFNGLRSSSRGVSLALSPQTPLDSNMNKQLPNNNVDRLFKDGRSRLPIASRDTPRRVSTLETAVPSHKLGFDMPSVVSMEILESQPDDQHPRNDAVIQRVSELKRLVEDAEQYLTGSERDREGRSSDGETASLLSDFSQLSKTESDGSGAYGCLRHSDSLLLLTQGQKQLSLPDETAIILDQSEHASSSDTDSVNTPNATPTHSPSQRPKSVGAEKITSRPPSMLKPSDSSFGLHSPDVLPNCGEEKDLDGLLRRLQDNPDLPFTEGILYLDPDIIDLTMIPPPITPEEGGMKFPTTINEPPTPFADRETLENELVAMKSPIVSTHSDLGELKNLTDLEQWADRVSESADHNDSRDSDASESEEVAPLSITSRRTYHFMSSTSNMAQKSLTESKRKWIAEEKRRYLGSSPELDKFIATVAMPPPPAVKTPTVPKAPASEFNEDFSAYIIPPPPANIGTSSNNGMAILQKLYEAREGIFQVMREDTCSGYESSVCEEKDRVIVEVGVRSEQREPQHGISRKISEIQRIFTSNSSSSSTALNTTMSYDSVAVSKGTTPDLSPASSHSSGYGSLKSITDCSNPPELPARIPARHFTPRKGALVSLKTPAVSRANLFRTPTSAFRTSINSDDDEIPPPPPPPRNCIPRMVGNCSRTLLKIKEASTLPAPGLLTKSSSQVKAVYFIDTRRQLYALY